MESVWHDSFNEFLSAGHLHTAGGCVHLAAANLPDYISLLLDTQPDSQRNPDRYVTDMCPLILITFKR